MKFPAPVVRAWRDVQRNFDFLATRAVVGRQTGAVITERRSVTFTMAAGGSNSPLNLSGVTAGEAFSVLVTPATHNSFTWYVHSVPAVGIVFINSSVAQSVTVSYRVIGS